jgi:DNA-binding PadR family transcriptional regulator
MMEIATLLQTTTPILLALREGDEAGATSGQIVDVLAAGELEVRLDTVCRVLRKLHTNGLVDVTGQALRKRRNLTRVYALTATGRRYTDALAGRLLWLVHEIGTPDQVDAEALRPRDNVDDQPAASFAAWT